MLNQPSSDDLSAYLADCPIVNWSDPDIIALATEISQGSDDDIVVAKRIFEWVRDNIQHSFDHSRSEVTCRASDVLSTGTGLCYAKSHLLAALARACRIPTGFCYQRLCVDDEGPPYCLHGLNAVYLRAYGWYRIDARGNNDARTASFTPPVEQLPFGPAVEGEHDLPGIYASPMPRVIDALQTASSIEELASNLPDETSCGGDS